MGVLDHYHGRIDHGAHRDRDAAQRHDVRVDSLVVHDGEGGQNSQRQGDDRDKGGTKMKQEQYADDRNNDELFDQLFFEFVHRALDQARAVVDGNDFDPRRQSRFEFLELGLYRVDGRQRVLSRAHDYDAAGHFAFAVQFRDAAPHFRTNLNACDVSKTY